MAGEIDRHGDRSISVCSMREAASSPYVHVAPLARSGEIALH